MVEDVAPDPGQPSIGEVRANNRFDLAPLEAWFRTNVEPPAEVATASRIDATGGALCGAAACGAVVCDAAV